MRSDRPGGDRSGRPGGGPSRPAGSWSRGDESSSRFGDDDRRATRPPQPERVAAPELPEDIAFSDLDRAVRARLRTLSKENAENVGLHLVMTGRLLDSDPELAYEHAQAAVRRAGRVDVVREAAGLAAYRTGRFAEALRELRTVRRLNGSSEHLAVMADCERGLGRPERALTLASSPEAEGLSPAESVELAIVVSGARLDLGEPEAAIAVLRAPAVRDTTGVVAVRVAQALAAAYEAAGRADDARDVLAGYSQSQLDEASGAAEEEDDVVVFDLDEYEQVPDGDETDTASDAASDLGAELPGARGDSASDASSDSASEPGAELPGARGDSASDASSDSASEPGAGLPGAHGDSASDTASDLDAEIPGAEHDSAADAEPDVPNVEADAVARLQDASEDDMQGAGVGAVREGDAPEHEVQDDVLAADERSGDAGGDLEGAGDAEGTEQREGDA